MNLTRRAFLGAASAAAVAIAAPALAQPRLVEGQWSEWRGVKFVSPPQAKSSLTWEDLKRARDLSASKRIRPHTMADGSRAYIFDLTERRFISA